MTGSEKTWRKEIIRRKTSNAGLILFASCIDLIDIILILIFDLIYVNVCVQCHRVVQTHTTTTPTNRPQVKRRS